MKLIVKLEEVNWGDGAMLLRPWLERTVQGDSARADLLRELAALPEDVIRTVVDAIPENRKTEILARLIREKKPWILEKINGYLQEKQLGVHVANLALGNDLTCAFAIDRMDLSRILDRLQKKKDSSSLLKLPKALALGLLRTIPGEQKTAMLVNLINSSGDQIGGILETLARRKGLGLKIRSVSALGDSPVNG